mmetsp:Transcript_13712/g.32116  ORF Transcript_13712/g.32116 Transcript_13712/m.32116 type:complete len:278 (-) Transcript_13712:2103-2936(-)
MGDSAAWFSKLRLLFCVILSSVMEASSTSDYNKHGAEWHSPIHSETHSLVFDNNSEDSDAASFSQSDVEERSRNKFDDQQQLSFIYKSSLHESPCCDVDSNEMEDKGESPSVISSSVLYDGEYYFSSEAMMCNGGGWETMVNRYINHVDQFHAEPFDSSDEDNDDDDDNDGHSSMLSTASLRLNKSATRTEKVRCHAGTGRTSTKRHHGRSTNLVRLNNAIDLRYCCNRLHEIGRIQQHFNLCFPQRQRNVNIAFLRKRVASASKDTWTMPIKHGVS